MKRLLLFCLAFAGIILTAAARGEEDFASRYVALYGDDYELSCKTISPQMMERIMESEGSGDHSVLPREVLSQIKSIRILTGGTDAVQAKELFEKAEKLARRNKRRYTAQAQTDSQNIYTRRHGDQLVECVLVRVKDQKTFYMLSLTGNMSDNFLQQILKI